MDETVHVINWPIVGVPGGPLHEVQLCVLVGKGDGWQHVTPQVNEEDGHSGEGQSDAQDHPGQEGEDVKNIAGEGVQDGLLQIVKFKSSFNRKVVIQQNHVSSFLKNL